jgi:hypothetical protein
MVHAFETAEPRDRVFGLVPCPSRFMPWVSLLLAQVGVPAQSFLGNMCGMYAGMAYAVAVAPGEACWQQLLHVHMLSKACM